MDRRKVVFLVVAPLLAIAMALYARSLVAGSAAPQAMALGMAPPVAPIDGPEVLVATRALPVGTILDATALKFQPWPKELVDGAYFLKDKTDLKTLQGTVVRNAITAGQPVTQGALVKPGDRGFLAAALGPGMRAVTFPVSTQNAVAGFVFPGDRIDLVLTQTVSGQGDPLKVSETIMRNVRVLATDQRTDNTVDEAGKSVVKTFGTVTVEATPKLAEQLAVAQTLGQISLSLRSLADNGQELEQAIASGQVKLPEGANGKVDARAEKAMLARVASQPQVGDTTFSVGADVSRFARRSVPMKTDAAATLGLANGGTPGTGPLTARVTDAKDAMAAIGPVVRVARGTSITVVPVGGKN